MMEGRRLGGRKEDRWGQKGLRDGHTGSHMIKRKKDIPPWDAERRRDTETRIQGDRAIQQQKDRETRGCGETKYCKGENAHVRRALAVVWL